MNCRTFLWTPSMNRCTLFRSIILLVHFLLKSLTSLAGFLIFLKICFIFAYKTSIGLISGQFGGLWSFLTKLMLLSAYHFKVCLEKWHYAKSGQNNGYVLWLCKNGISFFQTLFHINFAIDRAGGNIRMAFKTACANSLPNHMFFFSYQFVFLLDTTTDLWNIIRLSRKLFENWFDVCFIVHNDTTNVFCQKFYV